MFVFRLFFLFCFVLQRENSSSGEIEEVEREREVFLLGMNVYRTQNQRADGLIEGQGEAVMSVVFFFFPLETRQPSESENRQQQNA